MDTPGGRYLVVTQADPSGLSVIALARGQTLDTTSDIDSNLRGVAVTSDGRRAVVVTAFTLAERR